MEKLKVVYVEPGKKAEIKEIDSSLKGLQEAVGGCIEAFYPFEEEVCIVCNDEGKFNGMEANRAVYSGDGSMMDIIFGPFFICDCSGEDFNSLTYEQARFFRDMFLYPEKFISFGGKITSIKIEE